MHIEIQIHSSNIFCLILFVESSADSSILLAYGESPALFAFNMRHRIQLPLLFMYLGHLLKRFHSRTFWCCI
ncbi:Blue-light-activated histidine kinase [Trichinella pseudospiralis]